MPNSEEMIEAERIARLFHEAYEELAPSFGYRTREASAVPWERVPESNRRLMIATAGRVLSRLDPERERLVSALETIRAEPPVNYDSTLNAERIIRLVEIANAALNSEVSHGRE